MKSIHKIILAFAVPALMLCATSCLDDDPLIDWSQLGVVVELPYTSHSQVKNNVAQGTVVTFELMVNYTIDYADKVTEDIPVGLAVDQDMVTEFNSSLAASEQQCEIFPAGSYDLPSQLVIAAGTKKTAVDFNVTVDSRFEPGHRYLLPVVISSVPDSYIISGNFGHLYLEINMAD